MSRLLQLCLPRLAEVTAYGPDDFIKLASSTPECTNSVIPADKPTVSFGIGSEEPWPNSSHQPRSTPKPKGSLPFGIKLSTKNPPKKQRTNPKGGSRSLKSRAFGDTCADLGTGDFDEEVANEDDQAADCDEQDEISMAMPDSYFQELHQAEKEDEAASVDADLVSTKETISSSAASSSSGVQAQPVANLAQPPQPPQPAEHARGFGMGTFFNKELGITDIKTVRRRGTTCYHCNTGMLVGELRFSYAFAAKRPERSIHVGCLAQLPPAHVPPSVAKLQALLTGVLEDSHRTACEVAIQMLNAQCSLGTV